MLGLVKEGSARLVASACKVTVYILNTAEWKGMQSKGIDYSVPFVLNAKMCIKTFSVMCVSFSFKREVAREKKIIIRTFQFLFTRSLTVFNKPFTLNKEQFCPLPLQRLMIILTYAQYCLLTSE